MQAYTECNAGVHACVRATFVQVCRAFYVLYFGVAGAALWEVGRGVEDSQKTVWHIIAAHLLAQRLVTQ